jgi:hypothetical protein
MRTWVVSSRVSSAPRATALHVVAMLHDVMHAENDGAAHEPLLTSRCFGRDAGRAAFSGMHRVRLHSRLQYAGPKSRRTSKPEWFVNMAASAGACCRYAAGPRVTWRAAT